MEATPEPDRWCPLFEDALEVREWRRWAYRYRKSERNVSPGYRGYRERKFKILRQRGATVAALRAIVQPVVTIKVVSEVSGFLRGVR